MHPALSVRIRTARPARLPRRWAGSWARAALMTAMWSVAVLEPALPGRSDTDNGSPVPAAPWSRNDHNGWKPKPFLYVGAACSLS